VYKEAWWEWDWDCGGGGGGDGEDGFAQANKRCTSSRL